MLNQFECRQQVAIVSLASLLSMPKVFQRKSRRLDSLSALLFFIVHINPVLSCTCTWSDPYCCNWDCGSHYETLWNILSERSKCFRHNWSRSTAGISTTAQCTSPCRGGPSCWASLRGTFPGPPCPRARCPGAAFSSAFLPCLLKSASCTWKQRRFCLLHFCTKYQPGDRTVSNYWHQE